MNKTHYFAFVAGIIAAVLWIGAPYDSGTELIYLVVGLFVFGWAFDRLVEMRWGWILVGFHRAFCIVGVHDYKSYLDGLFCVWCHKQRHLTEAEIAKFDEEAAKLSEEKVRLYKEELDKLNRKFREMAEMQNPETRADQKEDS